jgi:hypothetical protein
VELDVATQCELDRGVVDLLPGGRDLRDDLSLVVARHHVVEHVAIDEVAVRIPLPVRVERRRLLHQVDHQHVFRRLRSARHSVAASAAIPSFKHQRILPSITA